MERNNINNLEQQNFNQQQQYQQPYQQQYQNGYTNPQKNGPKIIIAIIIICLLMCCCGMGGIMIGTSNNKNTSNSTENSTSKNEESSEIKNEDTKENNNVTNITEKTEKTNDIEEVKNNSQQSKEETKTEFKASCQEYNYNDIMRDPDSHKNKHCVLTGTVDQIIEGWFGSYSIFITDDNGDKWGCVYSYNEGEKHLLEGDYVRVYGILNGTNTAETIIGEQVSMPYIELRYLSVVDTAIHSNTTDDSNNSNNTDEYFGSKDNDSNDDTFSSDVTTSQRNAIKSARSYLEWGGFSRKGLIEQLSSEYGEQYPLADAEFAVSYLEQNGQVDWNEQAYKTAKSYMEWGGFSRDALYEQLTSEYGEQFTPEQANYALSKVGY